MIYFQRVRLRAIEKEDLPRFVAWLNDPEVRSALTIYLPLSQAEEEQWYQKTLQSPPDERPLVIEIAQESSWIPVGSCGFHQVDWRNRSGLLGIVIGEKTRWNQGYGTETMRLLLRHGFATLNLHRIWLQVIASNGRAIKAYEKAGFANEGCQRQAFYRDGVYEDLLLMSVLRTEWKEPITTAREGRGG